MVVSVPDEAIIGVSAEEWGWLEEMGIEKEDTDFLPTKARCENVDILQNVNPAMLTVEHVPESSLAKELSGKRTDAEDEIVAEPSTWTNVPLSPRAADGSEDPSKELKPSDTLMLAAGSKDQDWDIASDASLSATDAYDAEIQDSVSDLSRDEASSEESSEEENNQRVSRYDAWQKDLHRLTRFAADSSRLRPVVVLMHEEDNDADRSDSTSTEKHPAEADTETASVASDGDRDDLEDLAPLARVESHQQLPKRDAGLSAAEALLVPPRPCPTIPDRFDTAGPKAHRLSPSPLRQVLNSSDFDPESSTSPTESWNELIVSPEDSIFGQFSNCSDPDAQLSPSSEVMVFPEEDILALPLDSSDLDSESPPSPVESSSRQIVPPEEKILAQVSENRDPDAQSPPSPIESPSEQTISPEDDPLAPVSNDSDQDPLSPLLLEETSNSFDNATKDDILKRIPDSSDLDPKSPTSLVESSKCQNVPPEEDIVASVSNSSDQDSQSSLESSREPIASSQDDMLAKVLENCIQSAHALLSQGSNKHTLARSGEIANLMGSLLKDETSPLHGGSKKQKSFSDLIDGSAWR